MKSHKKFLSLLVAMLLALTPYLSPVALYAGGDNDAASISVADVTVCADDVEVTFDEVGNSYFRYTFDIDYSITLEDGSRIDGTGDRVWYNGAWHDIAIFGETQDQIAWHPGSSYRLIAMIDRTCDCTFTAYVADERSVGFSVDDVTLIEDYSGYYDVDDAGERYFHYRLTPNNFSVELPDLRVVTAEWAPYAVVDGEMCYPEVTDVQRDHHFYPGNTYKVVASLLGSYTVYNVTIVKNPVKAVHIDDISVVDHFDGNYYSPGAPEDEFFLYNMYPLDYSVELEGVGTVYPDGDGNVDWNGYSGFVNVHTSDEMKDWTAGNTYKVDADFLGFPCSFNVTVLPNDYAGIEIAGKDELTITLVSADGTEEVYHAKDLYPGMAMGNVYGCNILTEEGRLFSTSFIFGADLVNESDFASPFSIEISSLGSNTLSGCRWLKEKLFPSGWGADDVPGDANGDGTLNMKDVLLIRKNVAGLDRVPKENVYLADVNGDSFVDMKDVLKIRRVIAGLERFD